MNDDKPLILAVDDKPNNLKALERVLRREDAQILTASSGNEALRLCMEHDFALILLDVHMPDMDGFEVAQLLRAQERENPIPIIFITAEALDDQRQLMGYEVGAVDYLMKPVQDWILLSKVGVFLELFNRRRAEERHNARLQQEIEDHKKLRKVLEEREAHMRAILEGALDAIITLDIHGRIVDFNPAAESLFGHARETVLGQELAGRIIPPEHVEAHRAALARYADTTTEKPLELKRRVELPGLRADGNIIDLSVALISLHREGNLYFTAFLQDITDRKQLLKSLEESLGVAETSSQVKNHFIANMSHEIRTPMNAVIGFTELVLHGELSPKVRDSLTKVKDASHALMGILNDILDFSKIEAGQMALDPEAFRLPDMFHRLANLFSQRVSEKGVELVVSNAPSLDHILFGDVRRLEQVLINLMGNAVKFTSAGSIVVRADLTEPGDAQVRVTFSVRDTGIGMAPDRLPDLFEPFVQADGSTTRQYGGTGLGLSICKTLVDMLGGEIHVESQPGQGSVFSFCVPFECRTTGIKPLPQLPEHLQGRKVLLVDEGADSRNMIQETLEAFSLDVHAVSSGAAAVSALTEAARGGESYGVMILDGGLPGMDVMETAANGVTTGASTPDRMPRIILMAPYGKEDRRQQALEAGVDAWLYKPLSRASLMNVILEVFGEPVSSGGRGPVARLQEAEEIKKMVGGARILLVEDNPINQEIAAALLTRVGLIVEVANDGLEAVEKVAQAPFDAVLMDIQMPNLNGYEAARRIRRDARFKDLPIIAMTAHAMADEKQRCLEAGMNDHLAKPIRMERFYGVLAQWIGPLQTPAATSPPAEGPAIPEIAGVDQVDGLQRVAGDRVLYRRLLRHFRADQAQVAEKITEALDKGDLKTAVHWVHAVKGVAGNVGAHTLHHTAKTLEEVLKKGMPSDPRVSLEPFMRALTQVLEGLVVLEDDRPSVPAPSESTPEQGGISPEQLVPILTELAGHLDRNSLETDALMTALREPLAATPAAPILREVEAAMENYDFEAAQEALGKWLNALKISLK